MPLARFVIALALRAVIALFGLALTIFGGIYVVGSLAVLSRIGEATESGPPLSFLAQHFGLYGGLVAVGLFLIVVGIRGAIARIRAGLPADDEGVGKSPVSRLLNALIYGAGFAFGAFSLAVSIVPGTQMAMLVAQGITVKAEVFEYAATPDPEVWDMRYRFVTETGETITGSMPTEPVEEKPSMNLFADGIEVTYLPGDPTNHAVTRYYSHSSFVFFMVTRLLIAMVGLWGLMKNLSPPPAPGSTSTIPSRDPLPREDRAAYLDRFASATAGNAPVQTPQTIPQARPTRATFGKRGG